MRRQKKTIMWPAYLDATKTRKEGRKVPKSIAVPTPTLVELQKAAESLGLKPEMEMDKAHPSAPWQKTGRLWFESKGSKTQTLTKIAKKVATFRQQSKK